MTEFLVRSTFRGSLNFGWKSSADERELYIHTVSEETTGEKEHKKEEFVRIPTLKLKII